MRQTVIKQETLMTTDSKPKKPRVVKKAPIMIEMKDGAGHVPGADALAAQFETTGEALRACKAAGVEGVKYRVIAVKADNVMVTKNVETKTETKLTFD